MTGSEYRHILDVFPHAVVVGDRTGKIVYLNRSAERLLAWPAEALVGQPIAAIIPTALRGRHIAGFNRYRASRAARLIGREVRIPVLRKDGTEVRVEFSLAAFHGAGEELYVASLRNPGEPSEREPAPTGLLSVIAAGALGAADRLDPESLVRETQRTATAVLGAVQARLWLRSPGADELRLPGRTRPSAELGEPLDGVVDLRTGTGLLAEAGRTWQMVHRRAPWEDLGVDADWARRHQVETVLAVPLLHGAALQGVLCYFGGEPATDELLGALRLFALLLAAALRDRELLALETERDRLRREAAAYQEIVHAITAREALQQVLELILTHGLQLTTSDEGSLLLCEREAYVVRACAGYKTPIAGMQVPFGTGLTHEVVQRGVPIRIDDYQGYPLAVPRIRQRGVRAALGAPLHLSGAVAGALKLETKKAERTFSDADEQVAVALANLASLALAQLRD